MEQLPQYMKICYMALFNTTNEIGYKVLKDHGWSVVPHLKRTVIFCSIGLLSWNRSHNDVSFQMFVVCLCICRFLPDMSFPLFTY